MNRALIASASAIAVAALVGVTWYVTTGPQSNDKFAECRSSAVAGGAGAIGGPFTLVDETGQTVTEKDVINQPSLVYFGYTFCPDVCPLDSARNAEAIEILESRGQIVQPVFISIDPERDSPEVMEEFTSYLHPRMLGLTGTLEQIKEASRSYRTYFKKQEPEPGEEDYYLMDHSTFSYLVFPEDGFVEFFKRDVTPTEMADKIGCFLEAS